MKHRAVSLVLVVALLSYAVPGFIGCGKTNYLITLVIVPEVPVIAKGTQFQLSATATFSNGLSVPSWARATWESSNTAVATVSNTGLVTAATDTVGTAVITATDTGHPDIAGSVTVYITELQAIVISPVSAIISVSAGTSTQFTATGLYSAATPSAWSATWPPDLTTLVTWGSTSIEIATIGNDAGSKGIATAVTAGTTTITAMYTGVAGTTVTGTAALTVVP